MRQAHQQTAGSGFVRKVNGTISRSVAAGLTVLTFRKRKFQLLPFVDLGGGPLGRPV